MELNKFKPNINIMKKLLFAALMLLLTAAIAQAQTYKPFRVGLCLGYASPSGEGSKAGVLVNFEPSYRVNDAIAVGLRGEGAVVARVAGDGSSADASLNGSWTLNGQYFFSNNSFRPFAGLGFGLYTIKTASASTTTTSAEVASANKFGFYPRIGFELGHFVLGIDYNIIPATKVEALVATPSGVTTQEVDVKSSYLGLRFGFYIGGGRK